MHIASSWVRSHAIASNPRCSTSATSAARCGRTATSARAPAAKSAGIVPSRSAAASLGSVTAFEATRASQTAKTARARGRRAGFEKLPYGASAIPHKPASPGGNGGPPRQLSMKSLARSSARCSWRPCRPGGFGGIPAVGKGQRHELFYEERGRQLEWQLKTHPRSKRPLRIWRLITEQGNRESQEGAANAPEGF